MAMFFPGISKCSITAKILSQDDEVAFFPPFSHPDPLIQRYSDGVVDFAAVRSRPEFKRLVALYEAFVEKKECLFRNSNGAAVRLRFGQIHLVFFPLLLSFNAPETSLRKLFMGDFSETSRLNGMGGFEDCGLRLDYAEGRLAIQTCPTNYLPSEAAPDLVRHLNRRGRAAVEPFLEFIAEASGR